MPHNLPATRVLMNRLRRVMAEEGSTRTRLDQVVEMIASTMVADVCSIYLRLIGGDLLLIATEGLKIESVNATRLRTGEGLVGVVSDRAEPIAIQDAPRHPKFSYRPETGEDPFHAFLGVPILRGGRVVGVLTAQNRTERIYADDEIDTLQTIAMVLAEIVDRIDPETLASGGSEKRERRRVSLDGRIICEGLAYGKAILHDPVVPAAKFFAVDQVQELDRLDGALAALKDSIDQMLFMDVALLGEDPRDVMEMYRLLAQDPSWVEKLREGIRSGLSAEASVDRARREHRARLQSARDPYLKDRLVDLEDLDNRLLRFLGGADDIPKLEGDRNVLVARRLGPAELLEYAKLGLRAVIMEEAATSSHAAIVARALGTPTVGGLEGLTTRVDQGDWLIVDAESGTVHVRPDDSLYDAYKARVAVRSERQATYAALKGQPARTKDGVDVKLMLNAGLVLDMEMVGQTGADGVGLFRTEFQFLVSETLPRMPDQIALYKEVIDKAQGLPVIFRTVDLGGDKVLPALNAIREENPALGWRSIRFALDHPGLFRRQLRALIRAANERPLTVMFPMVTSPAEFFQAKSLLDMELEWSEKQTGRRPKKIKIGVMLETPALAYALPELANEIDFLSIGTNDLMQFFFAADRMTPKVSERYDFVSPAPLRFLKEIADQCRDLDISLSVCGEAAADPLSALCFLALGYHQLSMPAGALGRIKFMLTEVDLETFKTVFFEALVAPEEDFKKQLSILAADMGISTIKQTL